MRRLATAALLVLAACGSSGSVGPPPGKKAGEPCTARSACQAGLVCYAGACALALPAAASCPSPPGTQTIAAGAASEAVDPGPDLCVSSAVPSSLPGGMVQDLGVLAVGTDATFAVPAGTSSFVLLSQEDASSAPDTVPVTDGGRTFDVPNAVVPTNLKDPASAVWYDDLQPWPTFTVRGRSYPDVSGLLGYTPGFQPVASAFPVPATSAALDRVVTAGEVPPGTWSFTASDWAWQCPFGGACLANGNGAGRYRVHAVTRPEPVASTGTLDLEVYLATDPSSVLSTAAVAADHPHTQRWVSSIAHYLAKGGLCLGTVTFHDLPQWAKERYAPGGTVDLADYFEGAGPCSTVNQLFATAAIPARAVHLFVADDLVDSLTTNSHVVGLDGSIPGPSGFPGTVYGGAVLGLLDMFGEGTCTSSAPDLSRCGTDVLAYIAAHEIGHWLGLFHTSEQGGDFFDPVSDTARCPCAACGTGCGADTSFVLNSACAVSETCGGGRNLMFWNLDERRSTGELSRDQGQILRLNPAVR
jgi:hypothetical protein